MKFNYKKILKYTLNTILILLTIVILLILSLQIPAVQNFVKDKLVNYLENKIQTEVSLEKVYIGFPNSLVIKNLYLEGQNADTLLYVRNFDVGLDMLQFLNNKVDLTSIDLEGVRANVVRTPDGTFNFDYIIDAFATKDEEQSKSKPFIISLDKIHLKDISVSFNDQQAANDLNVYFNELDTRVQKFDLVNNDFAIGKIALDGLKLKLKQDIVKEVSEKVEEQFDSLNQQKRLKLKLGQIKFTNFDIDYGDENIQMFAKLVFKEFQTNIEKIDLEKNAYAIDAIKLDGLQLKFDQKLIEKIDSQETENEVETNSTSPPLQLDLNKINLTDLNIDYGDENSKTFAKLVLDELNAKINQLNLAKNQFDIEKIEVKKTDLEANLYLTSNSSTTSDTEETSDPLNILLGELILDEVKVRYHNNAESPKRQGIDFNHLNFSKLNLELEDFEMKNGTFAGIIENAEIQESKGINVQKLETKFFYGNNEAFLKDLYVQTPKTLIRDDVRLTYNSIKEMSKNPGEIFVEANIRKSKIGFADILMLAPDLRNTTPFDKYPNAVLNLDTRLKGKVDDLLIQNLEVSGLDDLKLSASGKIKNATNPDQLYYDLNIRNLSSSSKIIEKLVPKNTLPENINIPSKFSLNGTAKGTTEIIDTKLNLKSTSGNANLVAQVDMRQKDNEKFDVIADLQKLNIGQIISNPDLGTVTGKITAQGQSVNPEKMITTVNGSIRSATYNKYTYQNVNLDAQIDEGVFDGELNSNDPNADLNMKFAGFFREELTDVKLDGNIVKLDLQKLGFYADPMIVAGAINADFASLDPDELNGNLSLNNFAISDTKEIFPIQEMKLTAVSTPDSNSILFQSQIADVELTGKYKLTQIFGALASTVNEYYRFQEPTDAVPIDLHQYFDFTAQIKDDDLIRKFVPDLKSFETIQLTGSYDADSQKIMLDGSIPNLNYGENLIEAAQLKVTNENQALQYDLSVGALQNESFQLTKIGINGDIANDIINYNVSTKDEKDETQFLIAGNVQSLDEITKISLKPGRLILNYTNWEVANENSLQITPNGIIADNFRLTNGASEITVQSENLLAESPLNISIKDFKIEMLTEMIKKEDLPAAGTINGTAQIRDLNTEMKFTTDLMISDLELFENQIGDLAVKVDSKTAEILNADIALTGNNNDLRITGDFNTKETAFNLNLAINRLEMKSVQGFTMNAITDTEGFISGNLKIAGTVDDPSILGKVKFNEVGFKIEEIGSNFRNIEDAIDFTNGGILFNRFRINDADGNSLTLFGQVLTQNYQDFQFNLNANAKGFKVVNSEKSNDGLLYGVLAIDTNLRIRGDLDLPKISGDLKVTDETDFTFVLPQSSPSLQERDGIVEFIDQDQVSLQGTLKEEEINTETEIKGLDVSVNITLDKDAKTSIIIDKANGDFVEIQGEAELTGGMDPSGKTTLVGIFEVEKGAYEMSVSLLKRRFDIQKGSTITWTGEPTAAQLNITAIYKTEAPPIDLVQQQISGKSASEINQYKQRIPFNTELKLGGELMKPVITFDITMDDENNSVSSAVVDDTQAKLDQLKNDESEMNKQVFALLLLNRFIGENPFQSEAGISAETMARQSVSAILSQQLNNLASDLIQGVDINFGLDTQDDYSSGSKNTRTDLNVDISKRFLNDRLKVTIGSDFGLEGEPRENESMSNIAGDVQLDYMLSKDGRYTLRAYRKNEYQVALQGQIVETGVGFIITIDYDKFREIFEKSKRNKENRRIQRTESK